MTRESISSSPSSLSAAAAEIHDELDDSVQVWELAVEEIARVLPQTFSRLSPARASMLTDQIREILPAGSPQRLVCVAGAVGPPRLAESVVAMAVLTPGCDTANILHLDWAFPGLASERTRSTVGHESSAGVPGCVSNAHAAAIWRRLAAIFRRSGVCFVQWTTDPIAKSPPDGDAAGEPQACPEPFPKAAHGPAAMQFTPIGTLEYLSLDRDREGRWRVSVPAGEAAKQSGPQQSSPRRCPPVRLTPLGSGDAMAASDWEQLVARTYLQSLDCPPLTRFRTAGEILASYRQAASYAPDLWYRVEALDESLEAPVTIGCVLLARHPGRSAGASAPIDRACVLELVYMGIVPEHRGRDYGQALLGAIVEICQQQQAERLVLAVDQDNDPAMAAYRRLGMLRLFRETVWARAVEDAENG
ncbi:GNAT family N-acetyltransferase [Allorhodopirellula solitaria]|nr:GNAT family N-acetyltransferase [Allorhodopirellula solitaria]